MSSGHAHVRHAVWLTETPSSETATTGDETMTRYEIRIDGTLHGWSRTMQAAKRRADRLRPHIRTDVRIKITHNGHVLAEI